MTLEYATLELVRERVGFDVLDVSDNDLIQRYCNQINSEIEKKIGCAIGPSADTVRFYDGYSVRRNGMLFIRDGVRALTEVATASQTAGEFSVVDMGAVLLRPAPSERDPGWPAQYLFFNDIDATYGFSGGYANVRLTGASNLAFGFDEIPEDLNDVGVTTVVRAWLSRRTGETDVMGVDENNQPVVSRFISPYHMGILRYYRNGVRRWYARG